MNFEFIILGLFLYLLIRIYKIDKLNKDLNLQIKDLNLQIENLITNIKVKNGKLLITHNGLLKKSIHIEFDESIDYVYDENSMRIMTKLYKGNILVNKTLYEKNEKSEMTYCDISTNQLKRITYINGLDVDTEFLGEGMIDDV